MRECGAVRLVGFLRAGQSLFWYINNGWVAMRYALLSSPTLRWRGGVTVEPPCSALLCSAAVHFLICRIDWVRNRWNGVLIAGNNVFYGSTFIAVVSRIRYAFNVFTAHYEDNNVFFRCSPFCTIFIWLHRTASLVVECSLHVCGDKVCIDKSTFLTSQYCSSEKNCWS